MTLQQIIREVERFPCKTVCVTGGEPLIQQDLPRLIQELSKKRYIITIETNGSKSIKKYSYKNSVKISLDIKCPSSGMMEQMDFTNLSLLTKKDQLKCIIQNKKDYDYAKKMVTTMHPSCVVFFQPVWGTSMKQLSSWILRDGLPVRFGTQLHKIIWGAKTRK